MKKTFSGFSKPFLVFLVFAGLALGCKNQQKTEESTDISDNPEEWTLIFEDEFDKDLTQWNVWNSGAFNEEIQLYQPQQLSLKNGILTIDIERKAVSGAATIFDSKSKDFEYVSGRIESKVQFGPSNKKGEKEYRFVARFKLPPGHGMWPAFWTYGDEWPTRGEIDILEAWGGKANVYLTNLFYGPNQGISINSGTDILHEMGTDLTSDFHIYEMVWAENTIDIFFDGKLIHTYTANESNNIAHFFGKKHKVVFNTAVGGSFFKDRNSANYVDGSVMEVDWVRVYRR